MQPIKISIVSSGMRRILVLIWSWSLVISCFGEVKYIPASDDGLGLRRDLLPMDTDLIRDIAEKLAMVAEGDVPKDGLEMRRRVQALTLSLELFSKGRRAEMALISLEGLENRPPAGQEELEKVRDYLFWLADGMVKSQKEKEGYRLGQLMFDVLKPLEPEHQLLVRHDAEGELERWKGVVEGPLVYAPVPEDPGPADPHLEDDVPEKPERKEGYQFYEVGNSMPIIYEVKEGKKTFSRTEMSMVTLSVSQENFGKKFRFEPKANFNINELGKSARRFFEQRGRPLPGKNDLTLKFSGKSYDKRNGANITGLLAMLVDSAISGRQLRKNTIFIARLRKEGDLERARWAWRLLKQLDESPLPVGTRVIVGKGMVEDIRAMMVLGKAKFFGRFEFIEASTFEEAREFYFEDGKVEDDFRTAQERYQFVLSKAPRTGLTVGHLMSGGYGKTLRKARELSKHHLSARILADTSEKFPTILPTWILGFEFNQRLALLHDFNFGKDSTGINELRDLYMKGMKSIESLEKAVSEQDKVHYERAVQLLSYLRSAARVLGNKDVRDRKSRRNEMLNRRWNEIRKFRDGMKRFRTDMWNLASARENR